MKKNAKLYNASSVVALLKTENTALQAMTVLLLLIIVIIHLLKEMSLTYLDIALIILPHYTCAYTHIHTRKKKQ